MKRPVSISQSVRVFVTAVAIGVGVIGCAAGGDTTGGAGMGGAGAGGTTCALVDVNKIFLSTSTNTPGCTVIGACHDNAGAAAGLDLTTAGWQNMLVGHAPSATAGAQGLRSMCAGMNLVYLKAGSNPAAGLFIDKLNPSTAAPCGAHMPNLPPMLTAAQFACVQSYLTTLTK